MVRVVLTGDPFILYSVSGLLGVLCFSGKTNVDGFMPSMVFGFSILRTSLITDHLRL